MNENKEFLIHIYQNTEMGILSIEELLYVVRDKEFRALLKYHMERYKTINNKAEELLRKEGAEPSGITMLQRIGSKISIKLNTIFDNTSYNVAEMLMRGVNMGIIDIHKRLNAYDRIADNVKVLGFELLQFEESTIPEYAKKL